MGDNYRCLCADGDGDYCPAICEHGWHEDECDICEAIKWDKPLYVLPDGSLSGSNEGAVMRLDSWLEEAVMSKRVGYCAECGKVINKDDFAIECHGKLFDSETCQVWYESSDVRYVEALEEGDGFQFGTRDEEEADSLADVDGLLDGSEFAADCDAIWARGG